MEVHEKKKFLNLEIVLFLYTLDEERNVMKYHKVV